MGATGEDRESAVAWPLESVRARAVVTELRKQSLAAGPPTDDEVGHLTDEHWREVATYP